MDAAPAPFSPPMPAVPMPAAPVRPAVPAASAASPQVVSSWQGRLVAHLARFKRYPSSAQADRAEGTATLQFTVDRNGRVLTAVIVRSSGRTDLDQETLEMVQRAQPLPPMPPEMPQATMALMVPVHYQAR